MWSMPRSVLRVVAVIIAACAVGGFVLGFQGAPEKARLPGETAKTGAAIDAPDAQILDTDERPPAPPEKTEEELAAEAAAKQAEEEAKAKVDEAAKLAQAEAEKAARIAPPPPPSAQPQGQDKVGDLIDGLTPPPEQPPY